MPKYAFCGDVHGDREFLDRFIASFVKDYHLIFVGDYVDSFNESVANQIYCLDTVLDLICGRKATALLGNHELSYLMHDIHGASGWNAVTDTHIMLRRKQMLRLLKWFHYIPEFNCLVTHAGLSNKLLGQFNLDRSNLIDKLTEMTENRMDRNSLFSLIGMARGGMSKCGGPMWCDTKEFEDIPYINQVFGHSCSRTDSQPNVYEVSRGNWNIDSYRHSTVFLTLDEFGWKFNAGNGKEIDVIQRNSLFSPKED
jgi:hypothetical protein